MSEIDERDLRIDIYSNISKRTMRITHIPSGIVESADVFYSQFRTREQLIKKIAERLSTPPEETDPKRTGGE